MYAAMFEQAKKEYKIGGGGFFGIKDGESKKIRLVSEAIPHQSEYEGNPRTKFLCYVIDREDGKVKPYFMPVSVMSAVVDLQLSEDYGFQNEIPYDITIKRKKEAGKVSYSVLPSKTTALTEAEQQEVVGLKPLQQIIERIEAKRHPKDEIAETLGIEPPLTPEEEAEI